MEPTNPRILTINGGSSSIKIALFEAGDSLRRILSGGIERIGLSEAALRVKGVNQADDYSRPVTAPDHTVAVGALMNWIEARSGRDGLTAVGHRVVHGGPKYSQPQRITAEMVEELHRLSPFDPEHLPEEILLTEAFHRRFPDLPQVACFDTAFHHAMPASSYLYAIPYEYYEKYGIRKYGFHGTSHKFVSYATADLLGRPLGELKLITCHLGNGASITAVDRGNVLDTSMGMTPLNGLVMGTRCGDIDPAVVLYLVRRGMSADDIDKLLNKSSGLLGVSGIGSGDMRDTINASEGGNVQAQRALRMFIQRLVSYIGSYFTILEGADAVVFTGGIGENSSFIRERVINKLTCLGCNLDADTNTATIGKAAVISTPASALKAVVMPTNEELMIARETVRLLTVPSRAIPKHDGAPVSK